MKNRWTINRNELSEALNTWVVDNISIEPETCAHVRVSNEVQTCTTADVEVAIDCVAIFEHHSSSATQCININVSTSTVETSGMEHEELNEVSEQCYAVAQRNRVVITLESVVTLRGIIRRELV